MNCSIYMFGELSSGYVQFPEDTAANVLKSLYSNCKATTQIVTHRDGNILYYCYIRKLSDNTYIGLGIAVNGFYIPQIKPLFTLFEKTIENLAEKGIFIHFNENGELTTKNNYINKEKEEINHFTNYLREEFEKLGKQSKPLPPTDYTIAKNSIIELTLNDNNNTLVQATYSYGLVYIYKATDFDTVKLSSYQGVLKRINEENESLKKSNQQLKEENTKISRQKNKFMTVIILSIFIVGFIIIIAELYKSNTFMDETILNLNDQLETAQNEISEQESQIQEQYSQIQTFKSYIEKISNYEFTVGAKANFNVEGSFDNSWGEWMYADQPLTITSFYIFADKVGTINIELYNSSGSFVDKVTVNTQYKTSQKVNCNFNLEQGFYFMRVNTNDGISLQYHSTISNEYYYYSSGFLKLTGASSFKEMNSGNRTNTGYYQYFYQICYKLNYSEIL